MKYALPHIDVIGSGFTALDRIYTDGRFDTESLGGSCGNVLVSLAWLSRQVAPVLALGDDREGEYLLHEFVSAGADTRYIHRRTGLRSPILAQELDTRAGVHDFSFICPDTLSDLPRFHPIGDVELCAAKPALSRCSVFYADRLSESILEAMRTAWSAGAIVFFEPSQIEDDHLFALAMGMVTILKYSNDRIDGQLTSDEDGIVRIVTHGAAGLEVAGGGASQWFEAVSAPQVLDTCGSGDMVSVGVIDWIIGNAFVREDLSLTKLTPGVAAGQRLAAENCAYAGARGLFHNKGSAYARRMLDATRSGPPCY
ncbi:PfkB family carbohydrate kinase [uncultured Erythrobacter sp.]|uniref:PfkB family carbohydrate kinase n=1 Tax=uncultured Erythrobacter sp. TaxID=263913 RepID=UPI002628E69E|nr:PfkB family carbohydrate kinase [uncultured Erythrobacter sp.]